MQLDYLLNNKFSEQAFEQTVYKWLAEGDYTPDDIVENIITKNNVVLMPLYCYVADYYGSCSASLGYSRQEDYYEWDNINKRQVRKTRWVTDWYPYSQPTQGTASTIVYSGTMIPEQVMKFIESMDLATNELQPVSNKDSHYGDMVNLFKAEKIDAWNNRGIKKAYEIASQNTVAQLPSKLVQGLNLNINFSERSSFSVLAPYWFFRYEYKEKQYFVIADGNHPGRIDGTKPVDQKRKNTVIKIRWYGWMVGLLGTVLVVYLFSDESFDDFNLTWGKAGIILAGLILTGILVEQEVGKIKKKSFNIRKRLLDKKLKQLT